VLFVVLNAVLPDAGSGQARRYALSATDGLRLHNATPSRDVQGKRGVRVAVAPRSHAGRNTSPGKSTGSVRVDRGPRVFERSHRGGGRGPRRRRGRLPGRGVLSASRSGCRPTRPERTADLRRLLPQADERARRRQERRNTRSSTSRIQTGPGPACGARPRRVTRRTSISCRTRGPRSGSRCAARRHGYTSGDQPQPVLIVNDVKSGPSGKGGVALWIGPGTVAYFRNLVVTP